MMRGSSKLNCKDGTMNSEAIFAHTVPPGLRKAEATIISVLRRYPVANEGNCS